MFCCHSLKLWLNDDEQMSDTGWIIKKYKYLKCFLNYFDEKIYLICPERSSYYGSTVDKMRMFGTPDFKVSAITYHHLLNPTVHVCVNCWMILNILSILCHIIGKLMSWPLKRYQFISHLLQLFGFELEHSMNAGGS